VILFDGESSLASDKAKKLLKDKYNVDIRAEPGFKRYYAERAVKEIKLRTSVALELEGDGRFIFLRFGEKRANLLFAILGLKFNSWKKVLPEVLSAINYSKKTSRNPRDILKDYFTSEYPVLPQHMDFYKFKIGELVGLDLTKPERSNLTYKYSLYYGRMNKRTTGVIVKRRLVTAARDKYFTPFYTVKLTGTKVNYKKITHFFRERTFIFLCFLGQYVSSSSSCAQPIFRCAGA
jgi:hypothetical protein